MANTFFGFDSTLDNEANLLGGCEEDCPDTEEDEYDALNDETFGALEDSTALDDWEQQHEQFAEFAESSKQNTIENSISKTLIDLDDLDGPDINIDEIILDKIELEQTFSFLEDTFKHQPWFKDNAVAPRTKSQLQQQQQQQSQLQQTQIQQQQLQTQHQLQMQQQQRQMQQLKQQQQQLNSNSNILAPNAPSPITNQIPKKFCTVEELEREIRQAKAAHSLPHPQQQQQHQQPPLKPCLTPIKSVLPPNLPPNHPLFQHEQYMSGVNVPPRLPPGLHHPGMRMPPPPGIRHMPPGYPPPGFRIVPHLPPYGNYLNHPHMPPVMNHMMVPPGVPRNNNPGMQQQMVRHQQKNRNINNNNQRQQDGRRKEFEPKDEYAGLMSNREKQWLLNIQQLQVNTGTPYFDDYYYTVFKERKSRNNKENQPGIEKNQRYQRHNRNQDRQENTLANRVYTPLQFENSLGKLQCGSVTAPRKIIDMDVVTLEKDTENTPTRDTRKTKQLLLELEGLYSLMLKAEDLRNPLAISNMEKLVELKQKQRLRELDAASTPEQKQEILKLLQQETDPPADNPTDYINKVMNSLMQDDKFTSYLNIRKGKMLLLRVLPHLTVENFNGSFLELWTKVLLSLPVIGRRDTVGDNILLRLHPFFKRYIQSSTMQNILELATNLVEVVKPENSRSTPLSHQSRAPLYFVATNKFGVSALATMFVRTEYLASAGSVTEKELADWTKFVSAWEERASRVNLATPIERIPRPIFVKHTNRIGLASDKKEFLERYYVEL